MPKEERMNTDHYITTSIPYVNAAPHIGHALEIVQADALARYYRLRSDRVVLQSGTDENAHKNVAAAEALGTSVQALVDENSDAYAKLIRALDVELDSFIRTTEERHASGVGTLWQAMRSDDLYRKSYEGLYCEGCEDFVSDRDLVDGVCPDHNTQPAIVREDNYFFRLSRYQDRLLELIESDELRVYPAQRKREILAFVGRGLQDISISRDSHRMSGWGITVPEDPTQVIYVWIDALINYLTGIGYGSSAAWRSVWSKSATKTHVIGKNVWKFHAIYWPAMLLSAGLPIPDRIMVHGFLTAEGKKISKSLGNVIDPRELAAQWDVDPLRFYLLTLSPFSDGDFSTGRLAECYKSQLSSRIGSTVTRVTALCERNGVEQVRDTAARLPTDEFHAHMERCQLDKAVQTLMSLLAGINSEVSEYRPWEHSHRTQETVNRVEKWATTLYTFAYWIQAFIPSTGSEICAQLERVPVRKSAPLFPPRPSPNSKARPQA